MSGSIMNPHKRPSDSRTRGNSPPVKKKCLPNGSQSRGNSPPVKRKCPPKPSVTLPHDGIPHTDAHSSPSFPSPPVSRRGSGVTRYDQRRLVIPQGSERIERIQEQPQETSNLFGDPPVMSPRNYGSGPSTPASCAAPTVPSMLPQAADAVQNSYITSIRQQEAASKDSGPITMDSLRRIKEKKIAIASNLKPAFGTVGDISQAIPDGASFQKAALLAQQMDIAQLKKERQKMVDRLNKLERQEKLDYQEQLQDALKRISALEQSGRDSRISESLRPTVADHSQDLQGLASKIQNLARELPNLKSDLTSLKSWKDLRIDKERLMAQEVAAKLESATKAMQDSVDIIKSDLISRFRDAHDTILSLSTQAQKALTEIQKIMPNILSTKTEKETSAEDIPSLRDKQCRLVRHINEHIGSVRQAHERTEKTLVDRVDEHTRDIELIQSNTDFLNTTLEKSEKATKRRLDEVDGYVRKIQNFLAETNKFQTQHSTELTKLSARVTDFEQTTDTSKPISRHSLLATEEFLSKTTVQPSKFDSEVKEFRKLTECFEDLTTTTTHMNDRLHTCEGILQELETSKTQQLKASEKDAADRVDLNGRLTAVTEDVNVLHAAVEGVQTKLAAPNLLMNTDLDNAKLNQHDITIASILEQLEIFDKDFQKNEEDIHNQGVQLDDLKHYVPTLFDQKFDPLQQEFKEELGRISDDLKAQTTEMTTIRQHISDMHIKHSDSIATCVTEYATTLREDINQLKVNVQEERALRTKAMSEVNGQLIAKADADATNMQMDAFRLALRNLHDQYANITTDEVHQKMVHWFLSMYPSSAANMVQQFATIKQDVTRLQSFETQISWIQSRSHDLLSVLDKIHNSAVSTDHAQEIQRVGEDVMQLRTEFSKVNETLLQPNKLFLHQLSHLFNYCAELQLLLKSGKLNTISAPPELNWSVDLRQTIEERLPNGHDSGGTSIGDGARSIL